MKHIQKEHFEEWKSANQELENGQEEQKQQNEFNLEVIENLKTEIQVRTGSLTKIRNWKYKGLQICFP